MDEKNYTKFFRIPNFNILDVVLNHLSAIVYHTVIPDYPLINLRLPYFDSNVNSIFQTEEELNCQLVVIDNYIIQYMNSENKLLAIRKLLLSSIISIFFFFLFFFIFSSFFFILLLLLLYSL